MSMLLDLFWTFFKIGAFTFGGGYAMLPLVQDAVLAHGWMKASEIVNFIAVSESTPGPFAINISTYVGFEMAGFPGAICSTLGVVLPSFVIILIIAKCFMSFKNSRVIKYIMSGLKPAVIGLIASAVIKVGKTVFLPGGVEAFAFDASFFVSAGIFALMSVCAFKKVHPILVIVISAALGIGAGYLIL